MTRGVSHSFKVGSSYALLAGTNSVARRNFLTCEELLHRRHTGVYQQKAVIVLGNERVAGKAKVVLGFKKGKVLFAHLIK